MNVSVSVSMPLRLLEQIKRVAGENFSAWVVDACQTKMETQIEYLVEQERLLGKRIEQLKETRIEEQEMLTYAKLMQDMWSFFDQCNSFQDFHTKFGQRIDPIFGHPQTNIPDVQTLRLASIRYLFTQDVTPTEIRMFMGTRTADEELLIDRLSARVTGRVLKKE